jgi:hypothetical protein
MGNAAEPWLINHGADGAYHNGAEIPFHIKRDMEPPATVRGVSTMRLRLGRSLVSFSALLN